MKTNFDQFAKEMAFVSSKIYTQTQPLSSSKSYILYSIELHSQRWARVN